MCGVAAIASLDGHLIDVHLVRKMTAALGHRGPDDGGISVAAASLSGRDEGQATVLLGHRRLAILELTELGHQPMSWDDLTIVYNGEIYNHEALRSELRALGHHFVSRSDTEVLLHALRQWGPGAMKRLNGIFAFVVWDGRSRKLLAVRDRLGVKPLYFAESSGRLHLASEIRALLAALVRAPAVNEAAVYDFVVSGRTDHRNETFFSGIQPVGAGCYLLLEEGRYTVKRYWQASLTRERFGRTFQDNVEEFGSLLKDSIRLQMRADVPVACCLSGGLDSTAVVSIASQFAAEPLSVFTARYRHSEMDEWKYASAAHREFSVRPIAVYAEAAEFWADLDQVVDAQEEPFGGPAVFAQWRLMKEIHNRGIKVVLDGQGGDELLCGYAKYFYLQLRDLWRAGRPLRAGYLAAGALANGGPQLLDVTAARRYLAKSRWVNWHRQRILNESFMQRCEGLAATTVPLTLREMQLGDLTRLGLPSLLRYEDKNSMAHSVESRVPFLDHRLVEFALSIPTEHQIHGGRTKLLLRESLRGLLPERVRRRKSKLGFGGSWHLWVNDLRRQLAAWLDRPALRVDQYVERKAVRRLFDASDPDIFRILILDRWLDRFSPA